MTDNDTHTAGTPRWVKVFGIIALVLVVLGLVLVFTGRGGHGPGRHTGDDPLSGGSGRHTPPTAVHAQP